ncbi:uncharacterized protein LOC126853341 [Cataglyphis hispanica]|uniref:uncharacterized protein LOC126853341 n=1 Tax=Cataglyphis hispanica TaxID=1086592 RepID=UPI00217F6967|nr:uncharacterized protein LOC126853341 [Cataglyphis hispanica]
MASFRTKFQIFGLLISNKNKYNFFLRQQPWHCARPVLRFKKNFDEDRYNDKELPLVKVLPKGSERYGKKKKMRFLNFRRILPTKTEERSIINRKTQTLLKRKLTFWEYVFGPKKSLDFYWPIQKKMHHKENSHNQVIKESGDENVVINTEQVIKSSTNPRNLEPQSSPIYKVPTSVLLNRMIIDNSLYEKNNNQDKTITFATTRRSHDEMKQPSNFQKIIELQTDAKSENIKEPVPQMSTQISAIKARDPLTKMPNKAIKQKKPGRHSRIEQLEILVNEKKAELKRASPINLDSENSNK